MKNTEDPFHRALRAARRLEPLIRRRTKAARKACDDLLALPWEERETLIGDGRATLVRSRPVAEELIRRMREEAFRDPARAEELGAIAEDVVCCIPPTPEAVGGKTGWQDVSAHLWAHRANVSRIRCVWEQAHARFRRACWHLEKGSGDLLLKAEVFSLLASLLKDRRHHKQALTCLKTAEEIYEELEEPARLGKVLLKRAVIFREMESHEQALGVQLEACKLLEGFKEPELGTAAWSNLALDFCSLGDPRKAEEILRQSEPVAHLCGRKSTVHLNRAWVGGKIARALERPAQAEALLRKARKGYRRIGSPFDEALVCLDLAALYAEENRFEDLAAIAEETFEGLRSQQLEPEAEQALRIFVEAARRQQAAVDLIRAAAQHLGRRTACFRGPGVSRNEP